MRTFVVVVAVALAFSTAFAGDFPVKPGPPDCPLEETCPEDPRPDKVCISDPCGELGPPYYCQEVEFGPLCRGERGVVLSCPKEQVLFVRECCCVQPGSGGAGSLCRFACEPEKALANDPPVSLQEGYEPLDCVTERVRCKCDADKTGAAKTVELFCADPLAGASASARVESEPLRGEVASR